jgi:hypothetical protein
MRRQLDAVREIDDREHNQDDHENPKDGAHRARAVLMASTSDRPAAWSTMLSAVFGIR